MKCQPEFTAEMGWPVRSPLTGETEKEEMKKTVVAGGFICLSQSQPARPLITNNYQSKHLISTQGGHTRHKAGRKVFKLYDDTLQWQ